MPPINVEIVLDTKEAFHKGQDAQILCRSYGSRPVAQIHWYRNGQRILSRIEYVVFICITFNLTNNNNSI